MRETFRKIVSGVMAVLLMQLSLPAISFGEELAPQAAQVVGAGADGAEQEGSVVEAASLAGDDVVTVTARAHSVDPDGWSATVTYEKPQAGVPTEFTITADGGPKGSGSYQYQQGFIYKYDPYIWIYDPTFPPAETSVIPTC